jgi:hypothetical protein
VVSGPACTAGGGQLLEGGVGHGGALERTARH